jgi:hypothetical protein
MAAWVQRSDMAAGYDPPSASLNPPAQPLLPESTWTRPNSECPYPGRWRAVDAYATETEVTALVAAFVRALQPDLVVETGSWIGTTTEAIGEALLGNGHGELVSLEIDPDKAALAAKRCQDLPVTVLNISSHAWTPGKPIDFAWFDSSTVDRPAEFRAYRPWMHHRTVVGFHDTGPQHPVRQLIAPLVAEGLMCPPLYLPTPRGVCFARIEE